MPSADKQRPDDQILSGYLLGSLPAEESERLDELSITDDEFALRLDAVENDLVDAYTRGDLSGDALERFQKYYLSSSQRREKVEFARSLLGFTEKAAPVMTAKSRPAIPNANPPDQILQRRSLRRWFTVSGSGLQWGFAAAALVLLAATSYLFVENERLKQQAAKVRDQQTELSQHARDLERQLGEQRAANAGMLQELGRLRELSATPHALKIVAAFLLPQMRGASQVPTVSVPVGTDQVQLRLQLEADDFAGYQVALKDPAAGQVRWRSERLPAKPAADSKTVSVILPAKLLKRQNYILELSGISESGALDLVSSYPFRVVVR